MLIWGWPIQLFLWLMRSPGRKPASVRSTARDGEHDTADTFDSDGFLCDADYHWSLESSLEVPIMATPTPPTVSLVAAPAFASDHLNNSTFYTQLGAYIAALGVTDSGILGGFTSLASAANAEAAADVSAYGSANNINIPLLASYTGTTYAYDTTTSPPSLVPDPGIDATTIPAVGATPPATPPSNPPTS